MNLLFYEKSDENPTKKLIYMKKCLIIDNYDSFTDNLIHLLKSVREDIDYVTLRNSDVTIFNRDFDILVISPGPMKPENTGLLKELFDTIIIPKRIPTFGVCLGMQFITHYFGGVVTKASKAVHGSTEVIKTVNSSRLFGNINSNFAGARYNSLEVLECKDITTIAMSESGMIMALEHNSLPITGVQFHPESFLTENGREIISNFFTYYAKI